jgi:hypothetical protein
MSMISSYKDRVIIIGGKEKDNSESKVVEEIDFLKRNLVSLAHLHNARSSCQTFLVNDAIYVFGGEINGNEVRIGEKYILKENRWREIINGAV